MHRLLSIVSCTSKCDYCILLLQCVCESLECLAATTSKMLSACSTWVRDPGFALMTIMNSLFRLEKCRIELHKTSAIQPNFQEFGGHLSGMQCIFLLTNGLDLARRVYDIAFKNVERMDQIYNGSNGHGRVHSVFEIRAKCKPDSADMSSLACSWRMYHENMNQTPARNKILNSAVCWNFRAELEQKIHEPTTLCPCIFRAALPPPPIWIFNCEHANPMAWISQTWKQWLNSCQTHWKNWCLE